MALLRRATRGLCIGYVSPEIIHRRSGPLALVREGTGSGSMMARARMGKFC